MTNTKLFAIEFLGLAFLVPLIYYWLGIPEASTAQLVWSLIVGVLAVATLAFLIALALLRDWRKALFRTHWLCFFVFGFLLWIALCLWCEPQMHSASRWLASLLTSIVRTPIDPYFFSRWLLRPETLIMLSFVALAPLAAWLAAGQRTRWVRTKTYWLQGLAYAAIGLIAPVLIFTWVPGLTGATAEVASFTLRTCLALGLAVAAWIWFAQVIHREVLES
jgi:hypothetical protein